jgi:RNA polymerase sigma-70 factor (ECF subfamily)
MIDLQALSDSELLGLTQAGDEEAFVLIYRRHQGPVYRFALQMSGSESLAQDVTQEVFLALMRETPTFDAARGSLSAYLYGIARNHVLRNLERSRLLVSMAEDEDVSLLEPPVAPDDPLGDLTRREGLEAMRQAILALPLRYREVVVLVDLEEMSYAQAAQALGCAMGTVRSRLHRAHALLIEKLRNAGKTHPATRSGNVSRCFA